MSDSSPPSAPRITLPLRWILLVPFVVQTVGTVSLVGLLSFRNGNAAVGDLAAQLRTEATARVQEHLRGYLAEPAAVAQDNASAAELELLSLDQLPVMRRYFAHQLQIHSVLDGVYIADEQGRFLCLCGASKAEPVEKVVVTVPQRRLYQLGSDGQRGALLQEDDYDPRDRPWYGRVRQAMAPQWSDIYRFTDGELGITAAAPIRDGAGKLRGVAAADLRLTQISQFLDQLEISPQTEIFITEPSGQIVASSADALANPGPQRAATTDQPGAAPPPRQALNSPHGMIQATAKHLQAADRSSTNPASPTGASEFRWQGERHFVQTVSYGDALGLDWRIVMVMPESDFMAQIQANTWMTFRLCLGALLLSVALGALLARGLSQPLRRASQGAIAIAAGRFDHRLMPSRIREVNVLAAAFERMAHQLQASFTALEEANSHLEMRVQQRTAELAAEQEKAEKLLLNILPASIADQLKESSEPIARSFDEATILFADLVGFTALAARYSASKVVEVLNQLFCQFDALAEQYQLEKIKTIGDAYMAAAGLPETREDHAAAIANLALDMRQVVEDFTHDLDAPLSLRIGINSGKVVGGVIGTKKFIYDLWGDAVNIAARMESSGEPSRIQVTEATYERLQGQGYRFERRGEVEIKGRGLMVTYWLCDRAPAPVSLAPLALPIG